MKKIYIIHGWTYTTEAWKELLEKMKQAGFEPVMLKVPGLTEPSSKVWNLEGYVEWLTDILKNERDIILVGHSNGGRIAISYTSQNPGKVKNLILIDAAGIKHDEPALRFKRAVFGSIAKAGKKIVPSTSARKVFYKLIGAKDYEQAPENMRETMKNLIALDLTNLLPSITSKTLIIWGKLDTETPISDAEVMYKGIKGSKLIVISDAAHSPHKTHPERVVAEISSFIGS